MASALSERVELAKLCSSKDWSRAIRVLDSLLSQSGAIQDICNRAFCYSQLELHKHVIKDCDKALQLDPTLLQAYILKGHAFSALGRKEDALLVWEKGYEHALCRSADLKQLLELEDLLRVAKQDISTTQEIDLMESSSNMSVSGSAPHINGQSGETYTNHNKSSDESPLCNKLEDKSEALSEATDNLDSCNGFSDKVCENGNFGSEMNGNQDIVDKLSYESDSYSDLSDTSEPGNKLSVICNSSSNATDTHGKLSFKSNICNGISEEVKRKKKFCVARISKAKSISVDFRLSRGIAQVNEGNYAQAISIFDQILKEEPAYPEALIGRGTAYAFQRELEDAITDFTKAIQSNPAAGEAWKRRGQARAALGESVEAIEDLTKALEFEPNSADILHERGIVSFKFKDFHAAVEDLSKCVKLDKDNTSAYTYLGLALSSIGEYREAEEAHMSSIQLDRNFLEAWAHLTQLYHDLANPKKALECLQQVLDIDERYARAYHLRGLLLHAMGHHRKAIKDLSAGLSIENDNIECLYLRASCYHAIGEYRDAVKDYDAALDLELDSMEKFVLQCLAFYQKEIALYTASKICSEFCRFDIDGDIDPLFKEYWCKRLHPKNVCEKVFRQPPLRESLKKSKLRKQDFSVTKQRTALLQVADTIGRKIQYECPGFLSNKRQHRMAGLAALEIAQKVSKAWRSLQMDWKHSNKSSSKYGKRARRRERINIPSQNRGGAGCSTSSSSETSTSYGIAEDRSFGRSTMTWQDVYSLAVKWRQISEPCDPVVWINKLSEEFNSGFGSHTPLILGQAKVVRYFSNYERVLDVAKTVIMDKLFVYNKADEVIDLSKDGKLEDIILAKSCSDLYRVVGEDFWLATWCNSTAIEGKRLEGTRITLVKMGERGFDFAIRTPCTPSRWDEFDAEMTAAWEAICNAFCGENYGSTDFSVLENVRDAILRMTYYWYNFMPLSRGSAVVGFVVMLGLLLAANMEFTGRYHKRWLYPSLKVTTSWKDPDVTSTFTTTGSVVAALSSYED
ncbi:Tetratricopeptide repeat protein 13 [Morella rubra]|uniref:Tetratricopeptide repeat protein 13 n=1 Tax=Morella rubra TaxID=262757 RepID=A0A6A1VSF7_9ROSI|nr:Tetratricopeptide repeat protein 13 [Morella rubra]